MPSGIAKALYPEAIQLVIVRRVLSFIFLAYSSSETPFSTSDFLITGCDPILLVNQPISGIVIKSCLPIDIILLSWECTKAAGSTNPLMCIEDITLPPS